MTTSNTALRRRGRTPAALAALGVAAALIASPAVAAPVTPSAATSVTPSVAATTSDVIVRGTPGAQQGALEAIVAVGGTIDRTLGILDGASATIPTDRLGDLRGYDAITSVSPNAAVSTTAWNSKNDTDEGTERSGQDNFRGAMTHVREVINADDAYDSNSKGRGVDVAVIDSGVAPLGNSFYQTVQFGPDLSFENSNPNVANSDTYGHGTHIASIIAGAGRDGFQLGVASQARIVSVKVADAQGASDVSQVIAGIDWVVQNRTSGGRNIRVLNLSLGTDTKMDPSLDPLAYAADIAWRNGIVVVVSAGNHGDSTGRLMSPAANPNVIAVGAVDTKGTATLSDDVVPGWSGRSASSTRNVDVVAPGRSITGWRVPGSFIDANYPGGRYGKVEFLGSGTSQAAAVVSGAAAILIENHPQLTPDQVKYILREGATPFKDNSWAQGEGTINILASHRMAQRGDLGKPQKNTALNGRGSIDQARGTHYVTKGDTTIKGEVTAHGQKWNGMEWSRAAATGASWQGTSWQGATWQGTSWQGASWQGASWQGASWQGASWQGASWQGASWQGTLWSSSFWD